MKINIALPILFASICGFVWGWLAKPTPKPESPAIIYKARDGTVLATATPSRGKSYIVGDLDSVTFTTNVHGGIAIQTKP